MTSSPALVALAAAAGWFLVFFFVHIGGVRAGFENARWLLISYAACFLGTLATAIAVTAWHHGMQGVILAGTMAALTSACLFALYVPALYTVLTSLSVQTMMLLRRRGGALSEVELYDRFASRKIMEQRLATLLASGYVALDGPSYRLTPRGRAIANFFRPIKILWNLGPGG
jgi:glucose-6-phosphate-specific signal transduction histidine kinase